jgi:hypothetical protein
MTTHDSPCFQYLDDAELGIETTNYRQSRLNWLRCVVHESFVRCCVFFNSLQNKNLKKNIQPKST